MKILSRSLLLALAPLALLAPAQERLLVNAKVFTANPRAPFADAVALRGDTVVAVGSRRLAAAALSPAAQVVDLRGHTVLPGFIDSHVHVLDGGRSLRAADLAGRWESPAALAAFASRALQSGRGLRGEILEITGVPLSAWSHLPTLELLFSQSDFARRPVILFGADGHTAWANPALRSLAGVDAAFLARLPAPQRAHFGVSPDGSPNGFAQESALASFRAAFPRPSEREVLANFLAGVQHLHSLGVTAWVDPAAGRGILSLYRALASQGQLHSRVAAFVPLNPGSSRLDPARLPQVLALQKEFSAVPGLSVLGAKVFADGVAEFPTQSAAFSAPYRNSSQHASLLFDPAQFAELCVAATRSQLAVHVHAIGDRAVSASLDGFAAARAAFPNHRLPHTIAHLQFVSPADFPRFRQLGVLASFQLLWASAGPTTIDLIQPYIDPTLFPWQYPARSLFDAGATLAGGSDWAVSSPNPFLAIYQAETRRGPLGVLNSRQTMPRLAMLYAYTRHAALAMGQLDLLGSLEPGKRADLIVVPGDLLQLSPEQLKNAQVRATLIHGQLVHGSFPPAP